MRALIVKSHGHAWKFGLWLMSGILMLVLALGLLAVALAGRAVTTPGWVTDRIEAELNRVAAPASITLERAELVFTDFSAPQLRLVGVAVSDAQDQLLAELPGVSVDLAAQALLRRQAEFRWITLDQAELSLRRGAEGGLDLSLGEPGTSARSLSGTPELLDVVDDVLAQPVFRSLQGISAEDVRLSYTDTRAGRRWEVSEGLLAIERDGKDVSAQLFFTLEDELGRPSEMAMSFYKEIGSSLSRMSLNFADLPARDVATQSPALALLGVIDAPISGAIRTGLNARGDLVPLSAALQVGPGALNPTPGANPIRFLGGNSYFSYDPQQARIEMQAVELDTEAFQVKAEGQVFLQDFENGFPTSLAVQAQLQDISVDPPDMLQQPAVFPAGVLEAKVVLDPFSVRLGQVMLTDMFGSTVRANGRIAAQDAGWSVALDTSSAAISQPTVLSLWPPDVAPGTRDWVGRNVLGGQFFDAQGALRLATGQPTRLSVSHDFKDARVRFLRDFPPIEHGFGYLTISERELTIVVDRGQVTAPNGATLNMAGSVFRVADITQRPATADITIRGQGALPGVLSLLDLDPLRVMQRAGRSIDIAEGQADVTAQLRVVLADGQKPEDVEYRAWGTLSDVRSEVLVPGRVLQAEALDFSADRSQVAISGPARLDGVWLQGVWAQPLGNGQREPSTLEAQVELSQNAVDTFNIGLPPGSVSGEGRASLALTFAPEQPPIFRLTSDLNRVGLNLAALGWRKVASASGRLLVEGRLGDAPVVETLEIEAPGLSAAGRVDLLEGGGLQAARFSDVRLGGWLSAPVTLTGQGAGAPPAISIDGGRIDLRGNPFSSRSGSNAGSAITLSLDELVVSNGIRLAGVSGSLTPGNGLSGQLTGTVVGGAPVVASLAPSRNGTAIRVTSGDAGRVLRGAGIFQNSRGGTMDLTLTPRAQDGQYDGDLKIENTSVQEAPALASLLSAVSVVGLLEQMSGQGLYFSNVDAQFRLTPDAVEIKRGSAVGPSLGISLAGLYDLRNNRLDMQGVVSPVYIINAIGSVLTRPGEGLFGFNYRITGEAGAPNVGVNPLSIFTPGMFREIFRRPPPELGN